MILWKPVLLLVMNVDWKWHMLRLAKRILFYQSKIHGYNCLLKGAQSRIISISLKSQNIYLCHRKPTNNGLFLLTIAILKIEAKLFKLFPRVFKRDERLLIAG